MPNSGTLETRGWTVNQGCSGLRDSFDQTRWEPSYRIEHYVWRNLKVERSSELAICITIPKFTPPKRVLFFSTRKGGQMPSAQQWQKYCSKMNWNFSFRKIVSLTEHVESSWLLDTICCKMHRKNPSIVNHPPSIQRQGLFAAVYIILRSQS